MKSALKPLLDDMPLMRSIIVEQSIISALLDVPSSFREAIDELITEAIITHAQTRDATNGTVVTLYVYVSKLKAFAVIKFQYSPAAIEIQSGYYAPALRLAA